MSLKIDKVLGSTLHRYPVNTVECQHHQSLGTSIDNHNEIALSTHWKGQHERLMTWNTDKEPELPHSELGKPHALINRIVSPQFVTLLHHDKTYGNEPLTHAAQWINLTGTRLG